MALSLPADVPVHGTGNSSESVLTTESPLQPQSHQQQDAARQESPAQVSFPASSTAAESDIVLPSSVATGSAQLTALPPVADMQALAKRIGMASRLPGRAVSQTAPLAAGSPAGSSHNLPQPLAIVQAWAHAPAQSEAVPPSRLPSPAVGGPPLVPIEVQAIIQKLVLFIKVGPSGRACTHQSLLSGAWPSPGPLPEAD